MKPAADTSIDGEVERLRQLRNLLDVVFDLPEADRLGWIDTAADIPAPLREPLRRIVSAPEIAPFVSFDFEELERSDSAVEVPPELPRDSIVVRWRVQRRLGVTEQAEVYEAVALATSQPVALKLLRPILDTGAARRRARIESEALSRLDHPGIVRILDAGVVSTGPANGRTYLAMELVDGATFDDWVRQTKPSPMAIATAIAEAADAVHHANLRGVVHRDLKPSNLMVRRDGRVAVIDFGIARLLEPDDRPLSASLQSLHIGTVGTLSTMAPEQFSLDRKKVDLRVDVYALGVIAYDAIAGRLPIAVDCLTIDEIARRKSETVPTRLRAATRTRISRELSDVIAVALDPDPRQRYQSCDELAEDLRRVISGRPPKRVPPGQLRRAWLFAQRNALPTTLVAACAIAIAIGTIGVVVQREAALTQKSVAEARLDATRSLARWLIFDLSAELEPIDGTLALRTDLAAQATTYLDQLGEGMSLDPGRWTDDDAELALEIAAARLRLARILNYPLTESLGDTAGAFREAERAIELLDGVLQRDGSHALATRLQGSAYLVRHYGLGWHGEPGGDSKRGNALRLLLRAVMLAPDDAEGWIELARALSLMGANAFRSPQFDDELDRRVLADDLFARAHAAAAETLRLAPSKRSDRVAAEVDFWHAGELRRRVGDLLPASDELALARTMRAALRDGPLDRVFLLWTLSTEAKAGHALATEGRFDEAIALSEAALSACRMMVETESDNYRPARTLLIVLWDSGRTHHAVGASSSSDLDDQQRRHHLLRARTLLRETNELIDWLIARDWGGNAEAGYRAHLEAELAAIDVRLAELAPTEVDASSQ